MTKVAKERDFQEVANEYAHGSIKHMRDRLDDERQRENICSEGALEVQVRGDWHTPGDKEAASEPTEYFILLGTGGPAARIRGKLDECFQPETAMFEYQDWFKPWTVAQTSDEEDATLLEYAKQFWFGE